MVLKLEENKQNIFIFREGFTSLNRNPASVKLCRMYMHASMRSYTILTKHYKEFGRAACQPLRFNRNHYDFQASLRNYDRNAI